MPNSKRTVVVNIVGLCENLIGKHTPFLSELLKENSLTYIKPVIPAVTTTAQTTYLTGKYPEEHGIVANGWYFEEEAEVKLWRQSNRLVKGEKIWEKARSINPSFTCANLFWWYNMYSSVDYSVTPRPMYPSDGRKIPDIYTHPLELRDELQAKLGQFPLFKFWGPATSIEVSQWIGKSAKYVEETYAPDLSLIYIPHLDYNCQRHGPDHPSVEKDLREVDSLIRDLYTYFSQKEANILILSEYGITPVSKAVHINRILRKEGLIRYRMELGREMFDAGASEAFAMADHQIAHVYIKDKNRIPELNALFEQTEGIAHVLDESGQEEWKLKHERSGDLVLLADEDAWFTYYYWLEDDKAPDYARTVDIHQKPGYDPVEMFLDPDLWAPKLKIIWTLILRKLGFRKLMEVIPLDASLIKGSHGHLPKSKKDWPVLIQAGEKDRQEDFIEAPQVFEEIFASLNLATKEKPELPK
ncbi:MAG: nucleotide pyrophosphatase/phosphodiesterase family protein [Bacteroidota bacterium]